MPRQFADDSTMQLALRQTAQIIANPRVLAVFGIIVLVFAVTGPFGTLNAYGFAQRLGYWLVAQALAWSVAIFSIRLADAILGDRLAATWPRIIATGVIAGIPVSLASWVATHGLAAQPVDDVAASLLRALSVSVPLTVAFSALCFLVMDNNQTTEVTPVAPAAPLQPATANIAVPPILARLPVEKRGALQCMSAADHYVEIVTSQGRHLLLMRLADAISETAPEAGLQIHRSHWVALAAIARIDTADGQRRVILHDGTALPVSRSALGLLRQSIS